MTVTTTSASRADVLAARALVAMGEAAGRPVDPRTRQIAELDPATRASRPSRSDEETTRPTAAAESPSLEIGRTYQGTVVSAEDTGVYVEVLPGVVGLLALPSSPGGLNPTLMTYIFHPGDVVPVEIVEFGKAPGSSGAYTFVAQIHDDGSYYRSKRQLGEVGVAALRLPEPERTPSNPRQD